MKRIITVFIGILIASAVSAQNETDALRYSYLNYTGTARFAGLGGAMGALGADMSAIGINPAGMGRYSRSDFSFTSNLTFANTETNYNNSIANGNKANFNISNIGAVFVVPIDLNKPTLWKYFQFGVSTTRTNDFQRVENTTGNQTESLLGSFTDNLNNNNFTLDNVSDFYEGPAYDAYLLNYDGLSGEWTPWYDRDSANNDVSNSLSTTGAQYQTDITFSGNHNGNLYVGGSLGFPRIRYNSTRIYRETINNDQIYDLEDFTFEENVNTTGSGFNAKLGMIYLPVPSVRLGLAVHTPTWFSMNDQFDTRFISNFANDTFDTRVESPLGEYDYRLRTPGRVIASAAFLFKKRGFISLEYEYVDYANATLNDGFGAINPYDFNRENETITNIYRSAGIIKAGAEFRVTNNFTVRGGYTYFGSPVKEEFSVINNARTNISGGVGYRNKNFSLDLTYMRSKWQEEQYLFDPALVNPVAVDKTLNNFMVTAGFRF